MAKNKNIRAENPQKQRADRRRAFAQQQRARIEADLTREQKVLASLRRPTSLTESLIDEVFEAAGNYQFPNLPTAAVSEVIKGRSRDQVDGFRLLLKMIFSEAPRMLTSDMIRPLWRLYSLPWIRLLQDWEPRGHGRDSLFRSFADHLLSKYPMPSFLFRSFEDDDMALLFCHLAQGGSVYDAVRTKMLPAPLTRKMCHVFMQAPANFSILGAVRRAQVLAYGGSRRILTAILGSFLGRGFQRNAYEPESFWMTVIQWFCNQAMLDSNQVGPLLDYISYRRRENLEFEIGGRSPIVLIRGMEEWHGILAIQKKLTGTIFEPSGFQSGLFDRSRRDKTGNVEPFIWKVTEILSSKGLQIEGRSMHHCVFSYAHRVESGNISIWSLSLNDEKILTIEVMNRERLIVQVRGNQNRLANASEMNILNAWAIQTGLTTKIGRW